MNPQKSIHKIVNFSLITSKRDKEIQKHNNIYIKVLVLS